jgi:hypothetical protein
MAIVQVCVFCGSEVVGRHEAFVPNRIWGLQQSSGFHECGHQSVFEEDDSPYVAYFVKHNDTAANLIAKYGFSTWKNRVVFAYEELGIESHNYFKRVLDRLLKDIDKMLMRNESERKIKLLIENKFKPYKEVLKNSQ